MLVEVLVIDQILARALLTLNWLNVISTMYIMIYSRMDQEFY